MSISGPNFVGPVTRSGLVALYDGVQRYFTAINNGVPVYLGLKYRDLWDTSRLVIIDGQFDGSTTHKPMRAGVFSVPWEKKSVNPRELASWPRLLTLSIRGVDISCPDDERAQTEAMDRLIEQTVQGVWNAVSSYGGGRPIGQANIEWGEATWVTPPVQQAYGKELLVQVLHKEVLFDLAQQVRYPAVAPLGRAVSGPNEHAGTAAVILAVNATAGTALVGGLSLSDASQIGRGLELSGAAAGSNNGTFRIVDVRAADQAWIVNAAAVSPDANSGAIVWALVA